MAYFCFNNCKEKCLPQLEQLANEISLTEISMGSSERKYWEGDILLSDDPFYREIIMSYNAHNSIPLIVQTNKPEEDREQVKRIIRKLIKICKPTKVYKEPFGQIEYNLNELEKD